MKLLQINASPRRDSVSRQLTASFVQHWKRRNPAGEVIHRDLGAAPNPLLSEAWIQGQFADPAKRNDAQREALDVSDRLIDELAAASIIVIGDPMHNFGISAPLKIWIDQIVRQGRTFQYGTAGPKGLMTGKKVFVLTSRGGSYAAGTPYAPFDFQEPHLRTILGLIGLTDITFIHADNQARPDLAEISRVNALKQIAEVAAL
jgi:FMN-dependent NADH-azoreductase